MPKPGYKNRVHHEPEPKKKKKPGRKKKPGPKPNGKKAKEKLPPEHKNIEKNKAPIQKKTFPNYKGLTDKEFYAAAAQWADMYDKQRMERYTKALAEVIIHELCFVGELRVPYLGMFAVQKYKGYEYTTKDFGGKPRKVRVPDRQIPIFVPCDSLINDVNSEYATKEFKRRENRGTMSWRDYTRELRHEMWDAEEENKNAPTTENKKKVEDLHNKFRQTLACDDIRSLEKIIDISEDRENQLEKKKQYEEKKQRKEKEKDE